jgi:hypothetical protein
VRDVLALISCGNRIYEVVTATLGPLHLDQLPKSKPVTPYAVFTDHTPSDHRDEPPDSRAKHHRPSQNIGRTSMIP